MTSAEVVKKGSGYCKKFSVNVDLTQDNNDGSTSDKFIGNLIAKLHEVGKKYQFVEDIANIIENKDY
jgi:fructosamine-3-kinase